MFQFLGVIAELEKSTIADRFNHGRDTAVRDGKWTNGLVPFGYDLDTDGRLIVSERPVDGTGMTEGQIAAEIFARLAHRPGETLYGVCRWLEALGVPTTARFKGGTVWPRQASEWKPSRVSHGPPLALQRHPHLQQRERADRADGARAGQPRGAAGRHRPAGGQPSSCRPQRRGSTCSGGWSCAARAGSQYVGAHVTRRRGGADVTTPYYRCNGSLAQASLKAEGRCQSKRVPALELEERVKQYVRALAENPGAEIEEARRIAREKAGDSVRLDAQRGTLVRRLHELQGERDQIMLLFRRGKVGLDEAERQLDDVQATITAAKAELDAIRTHQELADATEEMVLSAAAALRHLTEEFERVAPERQREIIRAIVPRIVIHTVVWEGKRGRESKGYEIEMRPVLGLGMGEVASIVPK